MTTDALEGLVRHVHHGRTRVSFSDEDGNPAAVLIDASELERIERRNETLEAQADLELRAQLDASHADIAAGRTHSLDEILAELADRRAKGNG